VTIHAGHTTESGPSPLTKQVVYRTHPMNKLEMVARILQANGRGLTMIFTRTKRAADRVAEDLDFRGFAVAAVHGDLGQGARERALRAFRTGKIDVLVATDVAARGLDVSGVTHVLNYDCPEDPDTYTHRIGRTGRAGATGVAVTFVDWEDMPRWVLIDKSMGLNMPQPPETYHTSAALYADLDIPSDVSGTLPTAGRTRAGLSAEVEEDLGGGSRRGRTRDGGRGRGSGGAGGGGRSRRGPSTDSTAPSSPDSDAGSDEGDRPKRQRRRRRVETTSSETESAAPAEGESTPARTRRRSSAAATFSDDSSEAMVDSPLDSAESDGSDEGDKPRRRRRRGGRGNRGSGASSDSASPAGTGDGEMTGGSEAGVGTTA
jgi:superfamily II DNA/RNA helicase